MCEGRSRGAPRRRRVVHGGGAGHDRPRPLAVFLTPEGLPFYGGPYFPPQERPGMPSFTQVLLAVSEAWRERGAEIRASSEQLRERLAGGALLRAVEEPFQ